MKSWAVQRGLFIGAFLVALWQLIHVLVGPLMLQVQYVPDDSFYYLEIARNLAHIGKSSVDGGQTTTTGYHVLWAWLSAVIARIVSFDRMTMLRGMVLTSGLLALGTALVVGGIAWRRSRSLLAVVTLVLTSMSFLSNSVSATEWSLTIGFSVALVLVLSFVPHARNRGVVVGCMFFVGVLGSLSRSDFGGQAVCYVAGAAAVWVLRGEKCYLWPSLSSLTGAACGLGITLWRDFLLTGNAVQGSARMKTAWSSAAGHSPIAFFPVLVRSVFYVPRHYPSVTQRVILFLNGGEKANGSHLLGSVTTIGLLLLLTLCVAGWIAVCLQEGSEESKEKGAASAHSLFFLLSAGSMVLLYASVDTFNSFAMQMWYSAQITVAVAILLYFMVKRAERSGRQNLAYGAIALVSVANLISFAISKPICYPQKAIPPFGEAVRHTLGNEKIGASDSGIFNFVYGGNIINLDGLVNDDIIRYAPKRLPCYLLDKKITYFTGFGGTIDSAFHLQPYEDYSEVQGIPLPDGSTWFIRRVDEAKLRALPICAH